VPVATAQTPGRWTIAYEAGPLGIASGGTIYFQVSPFWGWSTPQVTAHDRPGFTEVSTTATGVELRPATLDQQLLGITIEGRALAEGERVRIVYGAGPAGAMADRFAEHGSRFWIGVDGDGDGVRKLLVDSPRIDVGSGPPARVVVTLPTTAHPGQTVRLVIAVLDARGNAGVDFAGEIAISALSSGLDLPASVTLHAGDGGCRTLDVPVQSDGIYRVRAETSTGIAGESNPMLVTATARRILWADLHGHSNLSDGTGVPDDYFRYARDVAALDVVALTDHDHWGMLFLDQHPELWQEIATHTRRFNQPGRFVTLLGFEWTSWIYGHRHVLFFTDDGPLLSSIDPAHAAPAQLWAALRGQKVLTFAHHSAGGPIATDWSIPPDAELEPVTEVVSVHGSSEADDSPGRIYSSVAGNFVRDALARGYRLGFVGSGDSHDGHPGLPHLAGPSGGLAGIFSDALTREAVYEALRARRTYATNGARIFLSVTLDEQLMGAAIRVAEEATSTLHIRAVGTAPVVSVDIVRSGAVIERVPVDDDIANVERRLEALRSGENVYVRVIQRDGGVAWSSPFFVE
jgi:hypothetical protein